MEQVRFGFTLRTLHQVVISRSEEMFRQRAGRREAEKTPYLVGLVVL